MNIDKNEFFRQVTVRICGSLDIKTALANTLRYMRDILPITSMSMIIYDPELNTAHIIASVGDEIEARFGNKIVLPHEGVEFRTARWTSMEPVEIINRPDLIPDRVKIIETFGLDINISSIEMRLELEGNRIGVLTVITKGMGKYTNEHAEVLQTVHEPFAIAMANALRYKELIILKNNVDAENRELNRELRSVYNDGIIGAEYGLKGVFEMVRLVAPLASPVILLGETGVGKEVIANAIHHSSPRRDEPFIKVNCGAIPENLLDSELFGHEKGAFTGAIMQKRGRFERANGGSIFLDEVAELPAQAQVRFLRVLQEKEIERVGGTHAISVSVRIITATHRNLEEMIGIGAFREDLWFRLNVFPIVIPPLRKRKEDIPALVHHFIEKKSKELKLSILPSVSTEVLDQLLTYEWPGNVRELENLIERALILSRESGNCRLLTLKNFSLPRTPEDRTGLSEFNQKLPTLEEATIRHIQQALQLTRGKIFGSNGAAELLGINPNTLRSRMRKLGIPFQNRG